MAALTKTEWVQTFAWYRVHATGSATKEMAAMLEEITKTVDDPQLDQILDCFANEILRRPAA